MARAPCLALAPAHPTCLAHNLWAFQLHCYGDLPGRQGRAPAVPASYCINPGTPGLRPYCDPSKRAVRPLPRSWTCALSMTGTLPTTNPNVYTDHYRFQVSLTADPAGRSPSTHPTVTGTARGAVRRVAARATTAGITVTIARCGYVDLPPDPVEGGRGARAVHLRRSASRRRSKGHSRAVLLAG